MAGTMTTQPVEHRVDVADGVATVTLDRQPAYNALTADLIESLLATWKALERDASVTQEQLILETHVDLALMRRPAMAFYPTHELYGDHTTGGDQTRLPSKRCSGTAGLARYDPSAPARSPT